MKFTANNQSEYTHYQVNEELPLLEWLLKNINQSRSKLKATLQGNGIKVEGKTVTQYDYPLKKGMRISISKSKKNNLFKSRYVKIVYEDR